MKRQKTVFMAGVFLLSIACAGAPASSPPPWTTPTHVPAELAAEVEELLAESAHIVETKDAERYIAAAVKYRSAYERTHRRVALWRHFEGLMLWLHYEETGSVNLASIIGAGQAATLAHEYPLPKSYEEQNQRMIHLAETAIEREAFCEKFPDNDGCLNEEESDDE